MIVSPSLLSADFGHLADDIAMLNRSEADWYHLDVMDGVFVPNISFGFPVMEAMAKLATKPLDVHLMIVQPEKFVTQVADLGAKIMNVHYEACTHLHRTVQQIKAAGMMAGVTLNPHTPVSLLEDIIGDLDLVMLMSVNPGFGGQKFIEHAVEKTRRWNSGLFCKSHDTDSSDDALLFLRKVLDRKGAIKRGNCTFPSTLYSSKSLSL